MKQKTSENKKRFGQEYPEVFKLKNLEKKPSRAISSDSKSASRGGISFPMPGKSPLCCVDATARDRILNSPEICSPQSSGCSLPSHGGGPLSHGERVGKLGSRVQSGLRVAVSTPASSSTSG